MPLALKVALSALRRPARLHFGDTPSQVGDLHVPSGPGPFPVAVLLHGGHWQARFGRLVCRPLALDLVGRGWAVWNLEYRRLGGGRGSGGGWPATFDDVAAGVDHLAALDDARLDLSQLALIGHSAGGQLALWAAGRTELPPGAVGAHPRVGVRWVVGLAPVTDLAGAGATARALMGGGPEEVPERWHQADPLRSEPPHQPVLIVHGQDDSTISVAWSREYVERCRAKGADVELVDPPGEGHRDPVDPASASWAAAAAWLEGRAGDSRPSPPRR